MLLCQSKDLFFEKKRRRAYVEKICENINKSMKYMNLDNESSLACEICLQKLRFCQNI